MKRHPRIVAFASLAALLVLVFLMRSRPIPTKPSPESTAPAATAASLAAVPPAANGNTLPPTSGLLAQISRVVPQVADASPTPVQLGTQPNGAIRFLGVQRGWQLPAVPGRVAANPAETARNFLLANRPSFGLENPRFDLTIFRTFPNPTFTTVRLQQTYGSLPVLAAETVVHVGNNDEIRTILADLATQVPNLDRLPLPLVPSISGESAPERAIAAVRTELERGPLKASAPQLVVYAPDVLGLEGDPALAWEVPVESPGDPVTDRGRAIIDANSGALLNFLDELHSATNRRLYDDNSSTTTDPTLGGAGDNAVRLEGAPATGITEVDNLYDFIGQTDAFYLANHQRNGYNSAGGTIFAIARSVPAGQTSPWAQASAGGNTMQFGVGYVTDDVVAHEYTHLVTEQTSRLLYQNSSGAINESLSDIFGEFMDLTNSGQSPNGNDAGTVRWEVGEDRTAGPIRSMKDPGDLLLPVGSRRFSDPDRLSSTNYKAVAVVPNGAPGGNDNGGVHSNSGVSNKLCFLLTDGSTFNGQTITPEGIGNVATLFYQVQVNYLVPASDWRDLYFAITNAAANLEWSAPRQINVNHACTAVEINTSSHDYYIDRSSPTVTGPPVQPIQEVGIPNVSGTFGPFRSIAAGISAVNDGGTLNINGAAGAYNANSGSPITIVKPMTLKSYNSATTIVP